MLLNSVPEENKILSRKTCANIRVNGIVQGVGFRPFIHRITASLSLKGWIRNTSFGAEIEVEGNKADIEVLVSEIKSRHPVIADIQSVDTEYSDHLKGYDSFIIRKSDEEGTVETLISPDIGICQDCERELKDPSDRRYRYPFINCTNCGPRFTIIKKVPYDRCNTSMADFAMCPDCSSEYHDINDRRYHAQPDCCPQCGPELMFLDEHGRTIGSDPLSAAVNALKEGQIVAVKGLGGFHLACRADDPELALKLRQRKHRDEKPFAIMCRDAETAGQFAYVSDDEAEAMKSFRKPIVLLRKKNRQSFEWISENEYIGVMLPYTPLHVLLMQELPCLIMTSANISDRPIIYKNEEAVNELQGIADGFLVHNREIVTRCDDSIMWIRNGKEYLIRRSRGFVPYPVRITRKGDQPAGILACGAEQKASFALVKGSHVFPCQHIGDLKNVETFEHYQAQIKHFEEMFDIRPEVLVCDLHPDYLSTEYARQRAGKEGLTLIQVQHHHAHMAACMADNDLDGQCIGIVWDGTGYGTDGTVWGGEFLVGGYSGVERAGSIRPVHLAGGDLAAKEIWRCGIALLEEARTDSTEMFAGSKADTVRQMIRLGVNSPISSSMGRLFDGVSALLGIRQEVSYEGQGAILLEASAGSSDDVYPYEICKVCSEENGSPLWQFDSRSMITGIFRDISSGRDKALIAADFMNTLASMTVDMCLKIQKTYAETYPENDMHRVVLSGGTFQNMYLLDRVTDGLTKAGFTVYTHHRVSTNDEGISLGQAAVVLCGITDNK